MVFSSTRENYYCFLVSVHGSAWLELIRRFGRKQRQEIANMLAHHWTVSAIEIQSAYCKKGEAPTRFVADLSSQDIYPSGPFGKPRDGEEDDLSSIIATLMAEVGSLKRQLEWEEDARVAGVTTLKETLQAYKQSGEQNENCIKSDGMDSPVVLAPNRRHRCSWGWVSDNNERGPK